jgi:hypothetical protein
LKNFFKRLSGLFGDELRKNQSVIAEKLNTNPASFSRYINGKTLPDVDFIDTLILYKKLNPDELYELITGIKYAGSEEKPMTELPKMFVIQTKNYIKSLENQIEELKHQRGFLEILVKDVMANRSQQEITSPEAPRQTGMKFVGNKLKRPEPADS